MGLHDFSWQKTPLARPPTVAEREAARLRAAAVRRGGPGRLVTAIAGMATAGLIYKYHKDGTINGMFELMRERKDPEVEHENRKNHMSWFSKWGKS